MGGCQRNVIVARRVSRSARLVNGQLTCTQPRSGALVAVNMLTGTEGGNSYVSLPFPHDEEPIFLGNVSVYGMFRPLFIHGNCLFVAVPT